ncbi:MAG: hypothetical protein MUE74_10625 [Bacteroidales bacterium]|jgi:WD40 repeat protein|nr:hypothetical protein [Bacteroidales bacterium]
MQKSPFKFLDSFTKEDRDIFFGRDREIEELHTRVFESKILLVYGTSGTGKSSLINCGLANRFNDSDWLPVNVRRGVDINRSLFEALARTALTKTPFERAAASPVYSLEKLLRSVWLDHFKPVFLIFDQFEELFIFGNREEKEELIRNVARVTDSDIQCRFIFSLREEYLAGVTEFEREIPSFLANRIRIEKMTRQNAVKTIEGPCRINNIKVEPGFAEALLQKLNPETPDVELTWLQIYLDKIMRLAGGEVRDVSMLSKDLLEKAGEVKDILGSFLDEQISQLDDPDAGMAVLKTFVSVKGTRQQITGEEVLEYTGTFGKKIESIKVQNLIQRFIKLRILRDKDENGKYELRHDSLASKIFEDITLVEKELLEVKSFIGNAYTNYEKRGLLLTAEDLKYIAPYEEKLYLNEKSQKFITESRRSIQKARRRRINIAIGFVTAVIVFLSFFAIWAMNSRKNAIELRRVADEQREAADSSRSAAEKARQEAIISQKLAEVREKEALSAKEQSDIDRRAAERATSEAVRERKRAEEMSLLAQQKAREAEDEKHIAEERRSYAESQEKEAKRLSLLATAQNLALISATMERNPEMMGLLAVQAFKFNISNGGKIDDPVIYTALDKAYSVLDKSKHSVFQGAANEIRSLSENGNGILGADLEGNVWIWDSEGNPKLVHMSSQGSYIDIVNLKGSHVLTAFEDGKTEIRDLSGNENRILEQGENPGRITAVSWSDNGKLIAAGTTDSTVLIWNTSSGSNESVRELKTGSPVRSMVFCGNDTLFTVQDDGTLSLRKISDLSCEELPVFEGERPLCIAWNKTRNILLAGCASGSMILIDPYDRGTVFRVASHTAGIDNIIFNGDLSLMATSSWDKTIRIYNYEEFFGLHSFVKGVISIEISDVRARTLFFTKDNRLAAGMSDRSIRIWETSPSKLVSLLCNILNRDMRPDEWSNHIGNDIPYEKTCGNNP